MLETLRRVRRFLDGNALRLVEVNASGARTAPEDAITRRSATATVQDGSTRVEALARNEAIASQRVHHVESYASCLGLAASIEQMRQGHSDLPRTGT